MVLHITFETMEPVVFSNDVASTIVVIIIILSFYHHLHTHTHIGPAGHVTDFGHRRKYQEKVSF